MTVLGDALRRRPFLGRLARPVGAFAAVVTAGVGGFSALGGVGLVDAAFWLLDPTSIELHFSDHEGPATLVKGYAIAVLSALVVAGLWIGETVFAAAFGGQLTRELRHMRVERAIEDLDEHVVVCGYGTFGKVICRRLRDRDRDVVVVEHAEEQHERAVEDGVLAVRGDARREGPLSDAGVERARTVVGAVDDSDVNIQVAISTRQLAPDAELIVRAGDEVTASLARRAGADEVVIPEVVSGERVTETL